MDPHTLIEQTYAEACRGIEPEWLCSENTNWYDYVIKLPEKYRVTYLLELLDAQVINGGFHQYFLNGYGQFAKEAIDALEIIGARTAKELLTFALQAVNTEGLNDQEFRKVILHGKHEGLRTSDALFEQLAPLDHRYWHNQGEDVMELVTVYLSTHAGN